MSICNVDCLMIGFQMFEKGKHKRSPLHQVSYIGHSFQGLQPWSQNKNLQTCLTPPFFFYFSISGIEMAPVRRKVLFHIPQIGDKLSDLLVYRHQHYYLERPWFVNLWPRTVCSLPLQSLCSMRHNSRIIESLCASRIIVCFTLES